jgi:LEA14-like dessication related protein
MSHTQKKWFNRSCFIAFIVFVTTNFSCSTVKNLANIQEPKLSIDQVRFTGLSFEDIDLVFDVNIDNPNQLSATLAGLDYDFKINDASFLQGQQTSNMTIAAMAESNLEVPLTLNFKDLYNTFNSLKNQDSSAYKIDLGLKFDLPILGKTRIPVSKQGYLPMVKLPSLKISSLKVKKMRLTSADLELNLEIDNPNAFNLLADNLSYNFAVNDQPWVKGTLPKQIQISGKGSSSLNIPVSVNFLNLGQTALQLLSGSQEVNYSFRGNVDLDSALPVFSQVKLPIDKSGQLNIVK